MSVEKDAAPIASSWLADFAAALAAGNPSSATALFLPNGWLRDLLVFSWDLRSLHGTEKVAGYLTAYMDGAQPTDFAVDTHPGLQPSFVPMGPDVTGVEVAFTFSAQRGSCRGIAYLLPDEEQRWRAFIVMIMLDSLHGHPERGNESGLYGNHTKTWQEVWAERKAEIERDPEVLIGKFALVPRTSH